MFKGRFKGRLKGRVLKKHKAKLNACVFILLLGFLPCQAAQVEENPNGFEMAADLIVARPIGLVILGFGAVAYVITLPFSLAGGNADDAARALVVGPAREVFVRCLGCRSPGKKPKVSL